MGAKDKKKAGPSSAEAMRAEVVRLIDKGRLKDAVKQAKLALREEDSVEGHRLLARAYLLRAQQLHRDGMPAAAREVAQHLLDHGITDPALEADAAELLLRLGMAAEAMTIGGRQESPELSERLARSAADLAVLHPERASGLAPEVLDHARRVRESLRRLADGDDGAAALEPLREIPRNSPLADWRLFARGLAGYYRDDRDEMHASWDRLDPARPAARAAGALLALAESAADGSAAAPPAELERAALGEPILADLRQLREHLAAERWPEAIRMLPALNARLRRVDPGLPARLTHALYDPIIHYSARSSYREGTRLLKSFAAAAEPLPLDPRWNRLWGMVWQGPQGSTLDAEGYWRKYIEDLGRTDALTPRERPLAQAMVWNHIAGLHLDDAAPDEPADFFFSPPSASEQRASRKRAVECLEESLKLAPDHRATHVMLYRAYESWGNPKKADEAAAALLKRHPDDLETLLFVADLRLARDDPFAAAAPIARARELQPLDPKIIAREYEMLLGSARKHAAKKKWEQGRLALEAADRLRPDRKATPAHAAARAAFERKAGDPEAAEAALAPALAAAADPTPVWLALHAENARISAPKAEKDRVAALLKAGLAAKARPEVAAGLVRVLDDYLGRGVEYRGRATHIKDATAYIRRLGSFAGDHDDMRRVVRFLADRRSDVRLIEKLIKRGLKAFPDSAYFLYMSAKAEMDKGPYRCNRPKARDYLERARARAQATGDPEDAALLPAIKSDLQLLGERDRTFDPPFFGGFPFSLPLPRAGGKKAAGGPELNPAVLGAMLDEMGIDLDDLPFDDEDDWDDEGEAPPPAPRPARKKGRKRP